MAGNRTFPKDKYPNYGMTGKHHTVESNKSNSEKHKGRVPWNKGKKGCQVPWNKGLTKDTDERVAKYVENMRQSVIQGWEDGRVHPKGNLGNFNPRIEIICKTCKNKFTVIESKSHQKYCSHECYYADCGDAELIKKKLAWKKLGFNSPNYKESELLEILNRLYPNEWKYVGDGTVIIEGKNPDFINCNGKKLIIELFGERWHKPGSEESRKEIFKRIGYETLIVWGKELKNVNTLELKIKNFTEMKIW